jgi:putative chitinase
MKNIITTERFKLFAPTSNYIKIAPALNAAANAYGIDNNREVRHWLAHLSVESAYFKRTIENLNYSAKRLTQVWPSRFKTLEAAKPYSNNPEALGNKVYGGRLGNATNEGFKYRGRGFIQLTGKDNYSKASLHLEQDLVTNPDLAATYAVSAFVAGWYWKTHNLDAIVAIDPNEQAYESAIKAARMNEEDDLIAGTRAINGGLIGLTERRMELHKAAFLWP